MSKTKQRRISMLSSACWLLLLIFDCSAARALPMSELQAVTDSEIAQHESHSVFAGGHHSESPSMGPGAMDCCDPLDLPCCEPASLVLPSKVSEPADNSPPAVLWATISPLTGSALRLGYCTAGSDWRLYTHYPRIHLLNCRFQD